MKKQYLSIICIIYSILLIYLILTNKLSTYLAPNMHIYIYLSIIPLSLIGIVSLIKTSKIKLKLTDLILVLPILMLILSGDGTLSISFAKARMNNAQKKVRTIERKIDTEKEEIKTTNENDISNKYDLNDIYFDVKDSTYQTLSNYLTYTEGARMYAGKTIRVTGFVIKGEPYLKDNLFALGRYAITCCAADAEFSGFMVNYDSSKVKEDSWYTVEGVLKLDTDGEGYDILSIEVINIKKASKPKDSYVYMCSEYGNGKCEELQKYDFIY